MSDDNQPADSAKHCSKKHRDGYDKINSTVAVIGLFVLIAYTTFAGIESCQMIKATKASAAAVRAWVIPTDVTPPPVANLKLNGEFPIYFTNNGKSPAFDLRLTEEFKYWDRTSEMPTFGGCPIRSIMYAYGALGADKSQWYHPPTFNLELNSEQAANLIAGKAALLVHACIGYRTVLNNEKGMTNYCTVAYAADSHATAPCVPTAITVE
jgi:hypothetical protein